MFQKQKANKFLDWDQVGFWVSMVCGVHCVAMPFVLGILPFTGQGEHFHELIEITVLAVTAIVGVYALTSGFLKHKNYSAGILMLVGFSIIFSAQAIHTEMAELALMPLGALFLALAHLRNHRLLHLLK